MATASMLSVTVADTGRSVVVPDDDIARLMYYLQCVTVSLGLDILEDDLVDYKNYRRLSRARTELVVKSALLFSPDEFIDKLIFRDDDDEIVTGTFQQVLQDFSCVRHRLSPARCRYRGEDAERYRGHVLQVFVARNVLHPPLLRILSSKHCVHCEGMGGMCECVTVRGPLTANASLF
jgi:hypothetical protein